MSESTTRVADLLKLVTKPTPEEIAELDRQIVAARKTLADLERLRRMLSKPVTRGPYRIKPSPVTHSRRLKVLALLRNGPMRITDIARELGMKTAGSISNCMRCSWFTQNVAGHYCLSEAGQAAAKEIPPEEANSVDAGNGER